MLPPPPNPLPAFAGRQALAGGGTGIIMNKYSQQPEATYDFHGLRAWEVQERLQTSLDEAKQAGHKLIHIIVGKGNNSSGAPVVRTMVQEMLMLWGYAYRFAQRHEGGEGVLVVHI